MEDAFEQAAWGLAEILGIRVTEQGSVRQVRASGVDPGGLLVDFLNELLLLHEIEAVGFARIRVRSVSDTALEPEVEVVPLDGVAEGIPVEAATYHNLRVDRYAGRTQAQVYLDV